MRLRAALLALAIVGIAAGARAQTGGGAATQTVDTKLGFSLLVPASWKRGNPVRNDRLVMGAGDEDFSLVVADFGAAQTDASTALAVYRESFLKSGLTPVTETDATIGGKPARRFVFTLDTPDGPGHAEAVLLRSGDEIFAVLVVTPAATADARKATIAAIFDSIRFD
jgi:predicted Zn-dependent protease